ncbi:hypothetical protein BJX66DRAFT_335672 [Aspergillus keveii]|uniref:Uncharacterized protein n=1 Tax=Aspergillus keveii TaxID=714993 RepID=A0ABR4GCC3_9EURO
MSKEWPPFESGQHRRRAKKRKIMDSSSIASDSDSSLGRGDRDAPSSSHNRASTTAVSLSTSKDSISSALTGQSSSVTLNIPCIECAQIAIQQEDDGEIRPYHCVFDNQSERCDRCVADGDVCEPLPQPFCGVYGRLMAMNLDSKALSASEDFLEELKRGLDARQTEKSVATQLKVLNRNVLRLINDRRESASKELLGDEHLLEWPRIWEDSENRLKQKHGL